MLGSEKEDGSSTPKDDRHSAVPGDLGGGPLVLLHDHLDGGLRPATVIDLARSTGYRELPSFDPDDLAEWFRRGANRRSLELYLETFRHTVAVLTTPECLERAAFECGEDLASDGVVYAESRFAPDIVSTPDMSMVDAIAAVDRGFAEAERRFDIVVRIIVTAMRDRPASDASARAAARCLDRRVVGFDIAGPEKGHPAAHHQLAFDVARRAGLGVTIHAGESYGLESIAEAVSVCEADRIGHGVRLIDDIGDPDDPATFGPLARRVLEEAIPLEMCPTSNIHTGAVESMATHPVGVMHRAGFVVTVNTDNRLMSDVTLSSEYLALCRQFGWRVADVGETNLAALDAAFCDDDTRSRVTARFRVSRDATRS